MGIGQSIRCEDGNKYPDNMSVGDCVGTVTPISYMLWLSHLATTACCLTVSETYDLVKSM
ncbi:MAG: hypothetical protein ACT6FC_05625 [Methanosarcinaceae archaeon]